MHVHDARSLLWIAGLTRSSLLVQESTRLRSLSLINSIRFACIIELVSIRLCSIASASLDLHALDLHARDLHALPIRCSACNGFDAARALDSLHGGIGNVLGLGLESKAYSARGVTFLCELIVGVCGEGESL